MTLTSALLVHAALSLGVFLCTLVILLHIGELDWRPHLSAGFALGVALVWPVFLALVLICVLLFFCACVLYLPAGIIAALRGKPLVQVEKKRGAS